MAGADVKPKDSIPIGYPIRGRSGSGSTDLLLRSDGGQFKQRGKRGVESNCGYYSVDSHDLPAGPERRNAL